jgi:hypothetical protein
MDLSGWLYGIGGILGGLGALFGGLAALAPQIAALIAKIRGGKETPEVKTKKARQFAGVLGIALLLASGATLNVILTTAAWDALNDGDYARAITLADSCVAAFGGAAFGDQAQLEGSKVPIPPKGKVSDAQKKDIHTRGPLNDVGTCLFIKGKAYESLRRVDEARKAYLEARGFTYARCWDPQGWFWSPSEAASGQIAAIDAKAAPHK